MGKLVRLARWPAVGRAMADQDDDERGFFAERAVAALVKAEQPRRKSRIISAIASGCASVSRSSGRRRLADYELLELLLFRSIPRARHQADRQGAARRGSARWRRCSARRAAACRRSRASATAVALDLKLIAAVGQAHGARRDPGQARCCRPGQQVLDYCRAAMAFEEREQFRILFLDKKNALIADEVQQTGTVDHTPVYPREVIRRALELSATAIILVHNHPSGDPTPSRADIEMTKTIVETGQAARHRRARPHHHRQEGLCQHEGPDC